MRARACLALLAALTLTGTACGHSREQAGTLPVVSPIAPTAEPVLTVPNITEFEVSVKSVREANVFGEEPFVAETAPPGSVFLIVVLHQRNVGRVASNFEEGNSNPVTLVDDQGRVFASGTSWSHWEPVQPGLTQDNPYSFTVPRGTRPSHLVVDVTDPETGAAFTGLLALNGEK